MKKSQQQKYKIVEGDAGSETANLGKILANRALTLGFSLVVIMLGCAYLGRYLGGKLGHSDAGIIVGMFAGFFFSGYEVWRTVREIQKADEEEEKRKKNGI